MWDSLYDPLKGVTGNICKELPRRCTMFQYRFCSLVRVHNVVAKPFEGVLLPTTSSTSSEDLLTLLSPAIFSISPLTGRHWKLRRSFNDILSSALLRDVIVISVGVMVTR
eukprot:Blabericola_migrator_1__5757@NODE_2916_length_2211_cov_15_158116_g1828_i0_p2_GENE_NODE_2916_length_2211_cov_15_158116_g1828_i0NODE_2916_length_2211_cov_15_158116_g1828_i0_p2_ORF_typecomplete_len110_score0_92_NODE_2916_length_2211_cov_15_158116_g1828_i010021331